MRIAIPWPLIENIIIPTMIFPVMNIPTLPHLKTYIISVRKFIYFRFFNGDFSGRSNTTIFFSFQIKIIISSLASITESNRAICFKLIIVLFFHNPNVYSCSLSSRMTCNCSNIKIKTPILFTYLKFILFINRTNKFLAFRISRYPVSGQ